VTSTHPAPDVGGRSTLEDVAARAGVSRATVSRVVNNSPQVSDAARRAVEAAIEVMGDAPNRAARSLAGHRSDTVALVVSEPSVQLFADPFFAGITLGITAALDSTPYLLVLLMSQSDTGRDRALRHLLRGGADGALVVSARTDDPLPGQLAEAGMPCVVAGRPPAGARVGYVDADNVGGARKGVAHLLASASPSSGWAARWPTCCSTSSTGVRRRRASCSTPTWSSAPRPEQAARPETPDEAVSSTGGRGRRGARTGGRRCRWP
jgi:transcriptional regulator with XRE-family HTH domain